MLSRTLLPRVRPQIVFPLRLSLATQQSRYYAKNKPRNSDDYKIPSSSTQSRYPFPTKAPSHERSHPSGRQVRPNFSTEQEEFQTSSKSRENTESQRQGAGPATTKATRPQSQSIPDPSEVQPEFQTSTSPEANTKPDASSTPPPEDSSRRKSKPLPDLTRGIPSTLDAELADAESKRHGHKESLNITEAPEEESASDRGGREPPKSEYIPSIDRKRDRMFKITMLMMAGFAIAGVTFLGRNWDAAEEEKAHPDAPSGWGLSLFYNRVKARLVGFLDYYNEPAFPTLLPEEDPQFKAPYTLVLSLEDLLVHNEWDREHGWRIAKRPGVDYFLRYLSQYYELVLFTSVPSMQADMVLRKLDPYRIIRWPLFREATRYRNGEYIKDLSYLNRDLSKVILIDTVPAHASEQPENAIILPKWNGNQNDNILVAFIPFLEYVATMGFDDVRKVIKSFEGTYIPHEFARREKALRERFEQQLAAERQKRPKRSIGSLASLFGMKSPGTVMEGMDQSSAEYLEQGKMVWDQIRERGQKQYEAIEKEIRENGEKWLAEMAAEEEKLKEEQMKGMKSSIGGWFGGGGGGEGGEGKR